MVKKTAPRGRPPKKAPPKQTPSVIKKSRTRPQRVSRSVEDDEDASFQEEKETSEQEPPTTAEASQSREGAKVPMMTIRTRRVAKSVTKKRWTVLSPESRAQAIAILRDIERPVLMAIKNENRRTTAQALIEHTINRIDAKLEKIPLPLGSKDRHFNFERIIDENREMESSLIPDLQLIGQLEKEIEREKRLLEQENSQLDNLTKNAAREQSLRKNQMKKMHPLLKENVSSKDPLAAINLVSEPIVPVYDIEADKDISAVMKDLGRHLTTLSANLKEMKEVRVWVNRAEESLGEILQRLEGSNDVDRMYGAEVI